MDNNNDIWDKVKKEASIKSPLWPATEEFVHDGSINGYEFLALRKLFIDQVVCDIGFGRGNILHAAFPFAKELVGFEMPCAEASHKYTTSFELMFLKNQVEKKVTLLYQEFARENQKSISTIDNIDVYFCAIGPNFLKQLNLARIFKAKPSAVIIYCFFLAEGERYSGFPPDVTANDAELVRCISSVITGVDGHHDPQGRPRLVMKKKKKGKPVERFPEGLDGQFFMLIHDPSMSIDAEVITEISSSFILGS